jgi:hypothetical protein
MSLIVFLALVGQGACIAAATAGEPSANPTAMPFMSGGTIQIKIKQGEAQVVGVAGEAIKVSWHSKDADEEPDVHVKVQRSGDKEATVLVDGPGNHVTYRVEVPQRSDVAVHMRAGDLTVQGIVGSMDADLIAGNLEVSVPDPKRYRSVAASVTAGEITAKPWRTDTGGLWRSLKLTGDGDYDLRARVIAGQLTIRGE